MWRDALLVASKDLRLELRSRVALNQVVPFAVLALVLFAFALDPDRGALEQASAGLFWLAVMFSAVLAVERAFAIETTDGTRDALLLAGLDPAGVFLGKALAVATQLVVLEVLLLGGIAILYSKDLGGALLLTATAVAATIGIASAGTLYGGLSAGLRIRETLLPILVLPVLAPVLLAATRAFEVALGDTAANGWAWFQLLIVFAVVYTALGVVLFGTLMEET